MLIITLVAIIAAIASSEGREIACRLIVMFYVLAPVDAYFTACEHNAGIEVEAPNNPRVAALLNMTTNGFGYFYIGNRGAFGLAFLASIAFRMMYASQPLLAEVTMSSLAIHAWKLASRARESEYPAAQRPQIEESSFPAGVPILVAALIIGQYWLFAIVAQILLWRG